MTRTLWPLLLGFGIWALGFVALYVLQALGCIWTWPEPSHRLALIALWIATLGALCAVLVWQWRRASGATSVMTRASVGLTIAAIAATALTYFPVTFATLCV